MIIKISYILTLLSTMAQLDIDATHTVNSEFLNTKGLCGLRNLGNTCFMNSIIQCLSNTEELLKYIVENKYKADLSSNKEESELVEQWNIVVRNLWYKNATFVPSGFLRTVQKLAVLKDRAEFTGFQQNDSQEFLQFFLEMFHNAICREVNMEIVGEPRNDFDKMAIDAYKNFVTFFKNDYSHIVKLFYGQFFTQVKTQKDNKIETSRSFEPFNMLSLELAKNSAGDYTLESCLENFTTVEKIDSSDRVITKEVKFWSLPRILVIYFKKWDIRGRKINDTVDFPLENLDMSNYVLGYNRTSYTYDLYAVSNHGGGSGGGHYWAYCKNNDGKWYKFNDNVVSNLSNDRVVSPEAYCLFYKLKN